MKSKLMRLLLALITLTLMANGACAGAEEVPSEPTEAQTAAPEVTAAPEASAAPTAEETAAATIEATATVESTETVAPTSMIDPSETLDPSETVDPTVTVDPTASIAPSDTPLPSEAPVDPNAPVIALAGLTPRGDGSYTISPKMIPQLVISWSCTIADATYSAYALYTDPAGAQTRMDLFADSADASYTWLLEGLAEGSYTLFIGARAPGAADDVLLWSSITINITNQSHGGMGGWGGGGRGGASGGMTGAADGAMAEDEGFKVTPGEALTDTHASGSKKTTLFGAVELVVDDEAAEQLNLGGETLAIALYQNGVPAAFRAQINNDSLILKSVADDTCRWQINGYALKTLYNSSLKQLVLDNGTVQIQLAPDNLLDGEEYKRLCAAGVVSADYNFEFVQSDGEWSCSVRVQDAEYALDTNSAQALYLSPMAVQIA